MPDREEPVKAEIASPDLLLGVVNAEQGPISPRQPGRPGRVALGQAKTTADDLLIFRESPSIAGQQIGGRFRVVVQE